MKASNLLLDGLVHETEQIREHKSTTKLLTKLMTKGSKYPYHITSIAP